jgi:hypothetical protein
MNINLLELEKILTDDNLGSFKLFLLNYKIYDYYNIYGGIELYNEKSYLFKSVYLLKKLLEDNKDLLGFYPSNNHNKSKLDLLQFIILCHKYKNINKPLEIIKFILNESDKVEWDLGSQYSNKNYYDKNKITNITLCLCYGNYSYTLIKNWIDKFPTLFNNSIENEILFIKMIKASSNPGNLNLSSIYNLSKLIKNFWFRIPTKTLIDNLFKYYNHNSQKILKKMIKENLVKDENYINDLIIYNIIKGLIFNKQYNLLKIFFNVNKLGKYDNNYIVGQIYVEFLNIENFKGWLKNYSYIIKTKNRKSDNLQEINENIYNLFYLVNKPEYNKNNKVNPCNNPKNYAFYELLIKFCLKNELLTKDNTTILSLKTHQQVCILDMLTVIPKGYKLLSYFENIISDWDILCDINNDWIPLLNASRYGDFLTFKYFYDRSQFINFRTSNTNGPFDILSASFYNTDDRVYKFIIENTTESDKIVQSEKANIETCIWGIFKKDIPDKYKIKRLVALNDYIPFNDNINSVLSSCFDNNCDNGINIKLFFLCLENLNSIQYVHPESLIKYIKINDENQNNGEYIVHDFIQNGYVNNIIDFFCEGLINFDWFHRVNQTILSYIKDLKLISQNQKSNILTCILVYLNNDYCKTTNIETILTILKNNNFDINNIKMNENILPHNNWKIPPNNYDDNTNTNILVFLITYYSSTIINIFMTSGLLLNSENIINISENMTYITPCIRNWFIVYRTIRGYFIRRNIKYKNIFNKKYKLLLFDLLNYPNKGIVLRNGGMEWRKTLLEYSNYFENNQNQEIQHINPINYQSLLNSDEIIISEKNNGEIVNEINEYTPSINLNLNNIKAEYIKDLDVYLVFDISNIQCSIELATNLEITPLMKVKYLRSIHPYTNKLQDNYNLSKYNIEIERKRFMNYINYERKAKKNTETLWYPKMTWVIKNEEFLNKIKNINNMYKTCPYPCDGWLLTSIKNEVVKIQYLK